MDYNTIIADFDMADFVLFSDLMKTHFSDGDSALDRAYVAWLYGENPFGTAKSVVIEKDGRWVAFMALVPAVLKRHGVLLKTYFVVNVLVDEAHQGKALFGKMIDAAAAFATAEGSALMGHPNSLAHNSWVRKGMHFHEDLLPYILIPAVNFGARIRVAGRLEEVDRDIEKIVSASASTESWKVLITREYIGWRYFDHPRNKYVVQVVDFRDGSAGLQIFRKMKFGLHMMIDQFGDPLRMEECLASAPVGSVAFLPRQPGARGVRVPLPFAARRRKPVFLTRHAARIDSAEVANTGLSASDF